jgi:two-component system, cell cycle sensor histidine kinase and response regulator CckA
VPALENKILQNARLPVIDLFSSGSQIYCLWYEVNSIQNSCKELRTIQPSVSSPPLVETTSESNFVRWTIIFGGLTSCIGVFGLLAWIPGFRVLVNFSPDYIPLAPATGAAFIFFGIVLLLLVRKKYRSGRKVLVLTIITFLSIYGLLEFIEYFADIHLTLDSFVFPVGAKLGPFDVKRMSPIAGIFFFFSGISLLLKVLSDHRLRMLNLAGGYGLLTLLAGFIAVLGYVFGTPLLYGGLLIPLSATNAVGFLVLGCGLVTIAGPRIIIIRHFVGSTASAKMLRALVPLIVLAILTEGYLIEVSAKVFAINRVLLSALLSLVFTIVTSILIVQIARVVFRKADKADMERRRVQHDLEASETRYRRLFESAKDGILILNAETGEVVDINPWMIELLGYPHEMFLGKCLWEIGLFKEIASSKEEFLEMLNKGYVRYEDLPLETLDGRTIDVEFVSNAYRVDNASVIQCNIRDITERKRSEESLLLQNVALQSAANAIMITERDGKIISVNRAFQQLTGYSREEAIGRNPNILNSGSHPAIFFQNLWRIILSGDVWKGEIENRRKDGSTYTEEMTITPVRQAHGDITHFIAIKQDITDRKKFQQELLQSQKIQSIGTLAGGIAHDFNNILAIILIYASLLERSSESKREKILESSRAIIRAVGRGKELVRQILTFARKTDIVFEPINVVDLIYEVLSMLKQTFPKVVTFEESIDKDVPLVFADRAQIHQVMLNLYVNARDAMPNGGSIRTSVELQSKDQVQKRFPLADQESYICIGVTDTGEGIDKATLLRIFDPFFTTKEKGKGTGLGLAVVYGVLQSHHGFIDVESELGHGTSFRLYFPISEMSDQIEEIPGAVEIYDVGGTETILLVEDEQLLIESVFLILKSKGYKVFTAQDGKEAVEVYQKHRDEIDLVLTDLGLPGITGKDVFQNLLEINADVKVVLASGFFEPEVKSNLLEAGVKGFIQKPYIQDDILRIIREVLDVQKD